MKLAAPLLRWAIARADRRIAKLEVRARQPGLAPWTEGAAQVDIAEAQKVRAWLVKRLGSHGGQP
jgi:hypothetical protein